nr:hypothetical protein CFP56_62181 [Quercus suber]
MASLVAKVLGLGDNDTERTANNETGGQEPVSGRMGEGSAASPYDLGNSENALAPESAEQRTLSNETGGAEPLSGETGAGTAASPYDQGNDKRAQDTAITVQNTPQTQNNTAVEPQAQPKASTTLPDRTRKDDTSIGSPDWFKTALPRKDESTSANKTSELSDDTPRKEETSSASLPVAAKTNEPNDDQVAKQSNPTEAPPANSDPTSVDTHHPHSNPKSIPTAGGIPLGAKPVEGR